MKKAIRLLLILLLCACLAGCSSPYAEFLSHYQQTHGTVPQDVYRTGQWERSSVAACSMGAGEAESYQELIESQLDFLCRELRGQRALVCVTKTKSEHYYPKDSEAMTTYDPFTWSEMEITKVIDQDNCFEDFDQLEAGDTITVYENYSFKPDGTFFSAIYTSGQGNLILREGEEYLMVVFRSGGEDWNSDIPAGIFIPSYICRLDHNTVDITTQQQLEALKEQDPRYFADNADMTLDLLRLYRESLAKED